MLIAAFAVVYILVFSVPVDPMLNNLVYVEVPRGSFVIFILLLSFGLCV